MIKDYWYDFINMVFDSNVFRNTHFINTPIANVFIFPKRLTSKTIYMIVTYLKRNGISKQELLTYYREIENHWEEIGDYTFLKTIIGKN